MITAVDTNVLLDVFGADLTFGERSKIALRDSLAFGKLIACDVVWAEVVACFPSTAMAKETMEKLGVTFDPLQADSALSAGEHWKSYRKGGGKRSRVVADFLIGAHASLHSDRLLTRDRGFYRKYFVELTVLDPSCM